MSGRSGIQTCPRCGRVLMGLEPCPNCNAPEYPTYAYGTARTYGVTSESNAPRWLLLVGAVLLLTLLVVVITQRSTPPAVLSSGESAMPSVTTLPATSQPTFAARPLSTPAADDDFWRKKAERDLRDAEGWEPTKEERAYRERLRTWSHFSTADEARATDFYMRRPEMVGRR